MSRWFASLALLAACTGGDPQPDAITDDFDRNAMLAHQAQIVLLTIQENVAAQTEPLPGAIAAYCDALDAGQVGTTRDTAHGAWRGAFDAWAPADAVLVGPAAMDNKALRERIYAWPLLSTCGVDRDTASRWADPASYDITTKVQNLRSLTAIEYLLFTTATAHTCATTPAGWDALAADLPRARCRLAHAIAVDVAAATVELRTAWRGGAGGDFVGQLSRAGLPDSSIPTAQEGINRISDGMFYVDRMVKDMKLGEAAGLAINSCGTVQEPCLREVESPYGDRGTFAIRNNLLALRAVFTGTHPLADGLGFDDFLRARGATELADRMTANLDAAIAKANALPDSYLFALQPASYAQVVETHTAVRAFTDDLKSQFLTVLALEIPDDVAADND